MYESYYGLRSKPFQLKPDPSFFYGSKGHRRAMSYLEYGLHQGEGFIVITGEVGAGKTTLVRNLFRNLESERVVAAQLVSTQLDADDALRAVAGAFGVPNEREGKAVLLKRLEEFLVAVNRQNKRALLVVDEAQNLTPGAVEELRMLSNFQTAEKSLLQSFLLGQPEFRYTLQSPELRQLRQRVIAAYHLGPLDPEETRAYMEHRLRTVGWNERDPSFDDAAFAAIFEATQGIPRAINMLCDRLMLMGCLEELHDFTESAVAEVVEDMQREMALPEGEAPPRRVNGSRAPETADDLQKLDARVAKIEESVVSVLQLSRQILSLPGVKRIREEGR